MKTCPCPCGCKASATTPEELESVFGWRGRIIQSYCKTCRNSQHKEIISTTNVNPILDLIIWNKKNDDYKTFLSEIPRFDENGKFITSVEKQNLLQKHLVNKYQKLVDDFSELLVKEDPTISEDMIIELFKVYNFDITMPDQNSFYNFSISGRLGKNEIQEEWKSKQSIAVILTRINGNVSESFFKTIELKLQNSLGIIISLIDENPLNFQYDTEKICFIDKEILKYLLFYRIDKVSLFRANYDGSLGFYQMLQALGKI